MTILNPEDRLIVAADFKPEKGSGVWNVHREVIRLATSLQGLGVYIKINSALRLAGYSLINEIHDLGLRVFADLKLTDISNTLATDGMILSHYKPELLTVMCSSGVAGMKALQAELPDTQVLGVTVLTSFQKAEAKRIFGRTPKGGVIRFAEMAQEAEIKGIISSAKEVSFLRDFNLELNTPGIRPEWSKVEGDDQKRVTTPSQAIRNGATRIVVGRPIVQACPNDEGRPQNPREAVEWTLKEIRSAC